MFQTLLFSYYVCDAAAGITLLDHATIARCIDVYQSVKSEFLTEAERAALDADPLGFGGGTGSTAYLRFRAWERENADRVAELKADARATLTGATAGM